ncbi:MAG: peptidoglycan DD-metalloendopeptidase family protein [Chloroflexi bacterium]|nr:peptidoglycan DD-metalloendopeptidase family protein [Chloroflexota bacterium]
MHWTIRQRAATAAAATIVVALAVLDACSGSGATVTTPSATPSPRVSATPSATASATPAPSPPWTNTATPSTNGTGSTPTGPAVSGFVLPIEGACLPDYDALLPNAPRPYRAGVHEGIDLYPGQACADIAEGTPVMAAKAGAVIRADRAFVEMTPTELQELLTRSQSQGYTDEAALDRFRGRQVWIDHGGGLITRYAHLSGIAPGIDVGTAVETGQVVGYVGNSGTPEAVNAPTTEMHLHFEIRVGGSYLGAGLPSDQVRALLERAFSSP